jgi:hypothetical protein
MILDIHSTLRTVFTVFAIVWVGVVALLFVATGLLLKKADKLQKKQHGGSGHHH